jgi:nifR3 family TIM-barrel protein
MISIDGLLRENARTLQLISTHPSEREGVGIQIFGDDPVRLADATRWVMDHVPVTILNINMGCPVDKVTRCNGGASLLRDPALIGRIVSAVKAASRVPLTVKIRAGWDSQSLNFLEVLRVAQDSGADGLICHPRTRAQGYSGKANWDVTRALVQAARIPIFGNGDIFTVEDVSRNLEYTGAAGVMIARGANGNPWIFSALDPSLCAYPSSVQEVGNVVLRHLDYSLEHFGEHHGFTLMKRHFVWYSRWVEGEKRMFRQQMMTCKVVAQARDHIKRFFSLGESETRVFPWWENASIQENHAS